MTQNTILVSSLVNKITFFTDNNSYRKSLDKIRKMASAWGTATNKISKSFEQGKRIADQTTKATDKQSRAHLKAYRQRQQTMKADQIRFAEQIKNNDKFRTGLQKINSDFLKGTTSFKERSAAIGALHKQYKALNQSAGHYNKVSGIAARAGTGVRGTATGIGVAVGGAAAGIGVAGAMAHHGFNKIKTEGQEYEALLTQLQNTFEDRAGELSNTIRTMADKNGSPLLQLGNNLVEFVSLMRPLGVSVDDAIKRFQQTQNAMQSYGIGGERAEGFQQQLTQALDQGTLDSFKEAFAWAPQLRADLLQYVQKTMKVSQKDFLGGLTNGRYNLKDVWFKFLSANESKYSKMSGLFKQSSMANDARSSNSISLAVFRIFESSGFQEALKYATQLLNRWGSFLEGNAKQVGEIFGNLYKVVGELADQGLSKLTDFLKDLTADDIRTFFNDLKKGLQDFGFVISALANFIRKFIPDEYIPVPRDQAQQNYKAQQEQTQNWRSGSTYAPGMQLQIPTVPTIKVPSFADNYVSRRNQTAYPQSNFAGQLDLNINAKINQESFGSFVDIKLDDYGNKQINMLASGG